MRKAALFALAGIAAGFLAGCGSDSSMSDTVKPNPEMANRYKQPANMGGDVPNAVSGGPTDGKK
ncbi:hypothetical protein EON82_21800 [bacterium]|nr:MAG: hypothetical protein EON82_21800 [bacterium]